VIVLWGLAFYVMIGAVVALAFVTFGIERALSEPVCATVGARILFFPGAVALWPYILLRWLKASR
jgi:hypothetical protein